MNALKIGTMAAMATMALTGVTMAETVEEVCLVEAADEGYDTAGCYCLQDFADANPGLGDELIVLRDEPDYESRRAAASDKALEAFDACYPV